MESNSFEVLCFIYNNVSCIRYKVIIILRNLEVLCNGAFHQCEKWDKKKKILSNKDTFEVLIIPSMIL